MAVSEEYINYLVEKYGNMILRLSFTYMKSHADAEDAVQEVFLKIIEKEPAFKDREHEKAWLIRVTANICKNKLSSFARKNAVSIDEICEIGYNENFSQESTVLTAVMSLPEKYRVAVHLFYYEEYSTSEIAAILGKNPVTVRSLLHRARQMLKEMLKEAYDFE